MISCPSCEGFIPKPLEACPNCQTTRPRSSAFKKAAMIVQVGAVSMTLMACYGAPPERWDDLANQINKKENKKEEAPKDDQQKEKEE